ncbi:hypothetical protein K502DRAFT_253639 [Neoconidiobolus thromboides FSU 785]|nr:hypothetical protein K502DRAFT_253639 [Neoconidiobolus thromboides FSU 785]
MSTLIRALYERYNKKEEYENDSNRNYLQHNPFNAKKQMIQNLITVIIKILKPLLKVSLIGILLDLLPTILKLKKVNLNINTLINKISMNASFIQSIFSFFKQYPKRNSWITALFFSTLSVQLISPTIPKYPIEDNSKVLLNNSLKITLDNKLALSRLEFELIVKQFLANFVSVGLGIYLLRFTKFQKERFLKSKHHLATAFYFFIQAIYSLWSFQKLRTIKLLKPWNIVTPWLNFNLNLIGNFSEIVLFSFSSYVVMINWFYNPTTLPNSFVRWINSFAEIDSRLLDYLRGLEFNMIKEGQHSDILKDYCESKSINPTSGDPYYGLLSCNLLHPLTGNNCQQHIYYRFISAFIKSLITMYIPLNLFTFILNYLFKKNHNLNHKDSTNPSSSSSSSSSSIITILKQKVLYPSLQSSAFLATFIATMFGTICLARNQLKTDRYDARLGSLMSGFTSILIESPSRRLPLTLYLLPRALVSLYYNYCLKYIPAQYLDTPLLTMSLATLLTCYKLQPKSLLPPLQTILNWIFDKRSDLLDKDGSPNSTPTPETCMEMISDDL